MFHLLLAYGFAEKWVHKILALVSKAFFAIVINGTPSQTFTPFRGIRQEGPLSPFLFLLIV